MIQGVKTKKLRVISDERGRLMEMLRSDDDLFIRFGQVYLTTAYTYRESYDYLSGSSLAAAYVTEDVEMVIRAGLAQIPEHSRLHAAVGEVLAWRAAGKSYQEAIVALHARWDEHNAHHWCHTISNAQICAVALLWGEGDYATAISRAVLPGLDTDCNGATVGSIVGMMLGAARLPAKLVGRLQDRIRTGVQGYLDCSISAMAEQMAQVVQSLE